MADGLDLDRVPVSEAEACLERMNGLGRRGSCGLSVTCSSDGPLLEAARLAGRNLCLLELQRICDPGRLSSLITRLKRSGVMLALRIRPEDLPEELMGVLIRSDLDILHLDLRGLDGMASRIVRRAVDGRGPRVMALADISGPEDASELLAMGAWAVSLRGAETGLADELSRRIAERGQMSGWYNAPKHICAGGDLRGLAYCCPPVKGCPVFGALKRAGLTPEEFVRRKVRFAAGTPLEDGEGTCFGSLVWCCKITKPCYLRDAALKRAGLSGREYMEYKRRLAEELLRPSDRQ